MAESKEEANFKSFLIASKPCGLEMKFLHATAPRSPIDMYTADACVATEKQPLGRRNCVIGQKRDYVLKVLQALLDLIVRSQMKSRMPRQPRWISTEKGLTRRSY